MAVHGHLDTVKDKLMNVLNTFTSLTKQPVDFLTKGPERSSAFRELSKSLFDYVRTTQQVPYSPDLSELLINKNFDDEQVWGQLELDNRLTVDSVVKSTGSLLAYGEPEFFGFAESSANNEASSDLAGSAINRQGDADVESGIESTSTIDEDDDRALELFQNSEHDDEEPDEMDDEVDDDDTFGAGFPADDDDEEDEEEDEDNMNSISKPEHIPYSGPASAVDDEFFKLGEMNQFLLEDEKGVHPGKADEDIDLFVSDIEDDEEDEEGRYKYSDFFDPPPANISKAKSGEDESAKSTFEKRQEKLSAKIRDMEEEAISEKPWQLTGEVSAVKRPENSLLEEYLQFDQVMRQPPVITEQVTKSLEDLILQRVKDKAWDDVQRKVKPKDVDPYEFKKKLVLDEAKSKQSLSQIYEQEYLKKMSKTDQEEEKPEHKKIRQSMNTLFVKLDALSNFHFVPKPVAPDIKIINNLPTLLVEEVQPSAMSTSQLLAPEEIQAKQKAELKGSTEATSTDKKRARRKKKLKQHLKAVNQKKKADQTSGDPGKKSLKGAGKTSGGSSTAFFNKLQETVKAEAFAKTEEGKESKKRKTAVRAAKSAKKFKL